MQYLRFNYYLIRIGEFADFISESFFDLNDGVGAEAIAFGRLPRRLPLTRR